MKKRSPFISRTFTIIVLVIVALLSKSCSKKSPAPKPPPPAPVPSANVIDSLAGSYHGVMEIATTSSVHGVPNAPTDTVYSLVVVLTKTGVDSFNAGSLYLNPSGYLIFDSSDVYIYNDSGTIDTLSTYPANDSISYVYHTYLIVDGGSTYSSTTTKRFNGRK